MVILSCEKHTATLLKRSLVTLKFRADLKNDFAFDLHFHLYLLE